MLAGHAWRAGGGASSPARSNIALGLANATLAARSHRPSAIVGRHGPMHICIYAYTTTAYFFRALIDACAAAGDDPTAIAVATAIRSALAGSLPDPIKVEVPCHSPRTGRWFDMLISARHGDNGPLLGATVTLSLARSEHRSTAVEEVARLPLAASGAQQVLYGRALLDRIANRLYHVGLTLEATASQSPQAARQSVAEALRQLDATIREIRDSAFVVRLSQPGRPPALITMASLVLVP